MKATAGKIKIRSDRRAGDDALIVDLHEAGYRGEGPRFGGSFIPFVAETVAEARLSDNETSRVWFAEIDGRTVGCAAMVDRAPLGQLRWVVLLDEARGRGLGRQLVDAALDYARTMGWREVYLETTHGLDASMGLYERLGFKTVADEEQTLWYGDGRFIRMSMAL